jgi:hypothetical protein
LDVSSDERLYRIYVRLPTQVAAAIQGADSMRVDLNGPHVFFDFGLHAEFTLDTISREQISLALRNCI